MTRNLRLNPDRNVPLFCADRSASGRPNRQRGHDDPSRDRERHGSGQVRRGVSERPEEFQSADGEGRLLGRRRGLQSRLPHGRGRLWNVRRNDSESGIQGRRGFRGAWRLQRAARL